MKKFLVLFLMLVLCLGAMTSTASASEKIEFWFHAANETSNAEYEKLFGMRFRMNMSLSTPALPAATSPIL